MCLSVVGHLQNIRTPSLLPLHLFNRLISTVCLNLCVVTLWMLMYMLWVFVSPLHTSGCVCLMHSQVLVPYALCLSARVSGCVGGLALAGTYAVRCALSLSPSASYLFVAHLCCAGPDTGVCQQREKQSVGNW